MYHIVFRYARILVQKIKIRFTDRDFFDKLYLAMPVTSSAIKKAKQDKKSRVHNRTIRDAYKKASKDVRTLVESGDLKKAKEALVSAYSKIDIATKKNVIHKNNAARRKARLSLLVKKADESKPKKAPAKKEK